MSKSILAPIPGRPSEEKATLEWITEHFNGSRTLSQKQQVCLLTAYGLDMTSEISSLPEELRNSLYGDVLKYGPAVTQIQECLERVLRDYKANKEIATLLKFLSNGMQESYPTRNLFLRVDAYSRTPYRNIVSAWGAELHWNISELVWKEQLELRSKEGLIFLFWLLNGQHLFDPAMINPRPKFTYHANRLLKQIGMPPLEGAMTRKRKTSR